MCMKKQTSVKHTNGTIGKHLQIKYTECQHIKRVNAMLDLYVHMLIKGRVEVKGERGKTLMIEKIDTPDHFTLLGSYVCDDNCLDTQ